METDLINKEDFSRVYMESKTLGREYFMYNGKKYFTEYAMHLVEYMGILEKSAEERNKIKKSTLKALLQ